MKNKTKYNKEVRMTNIMSLEQMEQIVDRNKSLSWNGWDVVELTKNPTAMFKTNGAVINGIWYIKNVFPISQDGWRIPNRYAE
jgi:hypothetical protein